jgi:hypothetical protein
MPAKSKAQQAVFGMADAIQKGKMQPKAGSPSASIAKTVPPKAVKEFASTPISGLPQKMGPPPKPAAPAPRGVKVNQTPTGTLQKIPTKNVFKGLAAPKGAKVPPAGNPQDLL